MLPATIPPPRRSDLVLSALGSNGQYVAKDPQSGGYYSLGEPEYFLLNRLDGTRPAAEISAEFEQHFGESLPPEDLDEFVELARSRGFLAPEAPAAPETTSDLRLPGTHLGTPHANGSAKHNGNGHHHAALPAPASDGFGDEERFLLECLDAGEPIGSICTAFEERFGSPLPAADLAIFLDLARERGYFRNKPAAAPAPTPTPAPVAPRPMAPPAAATPAPAAKSAWSWAKAGNILSIRKSFFDPDRLFNVLVPMLWFLWTKTFVLLSVAAIVVAAFLFWSDRHAAIQQFAGAFNWETVVAVWVTLFLATTLHEFAHGLTCKRYGGEVHEVGFLLMFFLPCLYCNVSDAWLIPKKRHRLWVTLAGGFCDLCVWALAVFAWRLTLPGTLINHLAWVVMTVLSGRIIFNFNPLLKLDGYYLLSDAVEIPNLQQRSQDYVKAHLRWLLWGAERPRREKRGMFLMLFGAGSWAFAITFLSLMLFGLVRYLWPRIGWFGVAAIAGLALLTVPNLLRGLVQGEFRNMLTGRPRWLVIWGIAGAAITGLFFIPVSDRAGGPFVVRSVTRAELRAKVAGFVREVKFDEGDRVTKGQLVLVIEVPDLDSRLAQKKAEVREVRAKLTLLEVGARPEEKREQRLRVERAERSRDEGEAYLERARKVLESDLARFDERIELAQREIQFAETSLERLRGLKVRNNASDEEVEAAQRRLGQAKSELIQEQTQRRSRAAQGTTEAEAELRKREKELSDAKGALTLLEAGARPQEIESERARLHRLEEEVRFLEEQQQRTPLVSPVDGLVMTPRLKEKIGQFVREGDLLVQIEEPSMLEVEITMPEQDVPRVQVGQEVQLTARSLPFASHKTQVDRIAPGAGTRVDASQTALVVPKGDQPGSVTVYCRLPGESALRSGMTGYARVKCEKRSLGLIAAERVLRYLRTEFWW